MVGNNNLVDKSVTEVIYMDACMTNEEHHEVLQREILFKMSSDVISATENSSRKSMETCEVDNELCPNTNGLKQGGLQSPCVSYFYIDVSQDLGVIGQ